MTSRTKFVQSGNYVTVTEEGEGTEYFVPYGGGYVRINDNAGRHPQVCEMLCDRGNTLTAEPDTLLALIRCEHARAKRFDRKQAKRFADGYNY